MATKEKSLVDLVWFRRSSLTPTALPEFLIDDLRIDRAVLESISLSALNEIATSFHHPTVKALSKMIQKVLR